MASWSALATMMRSYGSLSSAVRRSTEVRSSTRTMRASVSFAPDRSPTSRDPVAHHHALAAQLAGLHRGDRAVLDQDTSAGPGRRSGPCPRRRPRAWGGCGCAGGCPCGWGGRGCRPRRCACRSGASSEPSQALLRRAAEHARPTAAGSRAASCAVVATFSTSTPSTARPMIAPAVAMPVVVVRVEDPAVQRARADAQAVRGLGDVAAQLVDLLGERRQPVRLVQPQMGDAAQRGRRSRRAPRRPRCPGSARRPRSRSTSMPWIRPPPVKVRPRSVQLAGAAHRREDLAQRVTGLGGVLAASREW